MKNPSKKLINEELVINKWEIYTTNISCILYTSTFFYAFQQCFAFLKWIILDIPKTFSSIPYFFSSHHSIDWWIDFFYFYRKFFSILSKSIHFPWKRKNARRNFLTKSSQVVLTINRNQEKRPKCEHKLKKCTTTMKKWQVKTCYFENNERDK